MADKHVRLGKEGSKLLQQAKGLMMYKNPNDKITDESTVIKALEKYLRDNDDRDRNRIPKTRKKE